MKFDVQLQAAGCADGTYRIEAQGCAMASLYWADGQGPLESWTAFAHVPLDVSGRGEFHEAGGRAIPPSASHAAACLISPDGEVRETLLAPVSSAPACPQEKRPLRIGVMSDLHLSTKPYRIRSAMRLLKEADCILLAGDLTNDGLPEQFELLLRCIEEELGDVPVFAVTGNHDYPVKPLPLVYTGADDYHRFQTWLLERACALGVACQEDESGAYEARLNGCSIFGLNAVSHFRRFVFPDGKQLDWLENGLRACTAPHRLVLCHAPLRCHNSNDRKAVNAPYLSRDKRLQSIIEDAGSLCFVSGHTHVSINEEESCAEHDARRGVLYLNDSCVTKTALKKSDGMHQDGEWTDGAALMLTLSEREMEIAARGVLSKKWISRGYYRFSY
ncbi:MAG: metallophosphoesterase [Clostridia bacterium]|nr:metallophosphoesterase [Clostridia bacterium]